MKLLCGAVIVVACGLSGLTRATHADGVDQPAIACSANSGSCGGQLAAREPLRAVRHRLFDMRSKTRYRLSQRLARRSCAGARNCGA